MSDGETEAEFEAHGLSSSIPLTTTPERCSPSPPLLHGSAEHIGTMADTYYNAWWNQRRGLRSTIGRAFRKEKAPPVTANDLSWREDPEELTTWAIARHRPNRPDWLFAIDVNRVPSQVLPDEASHVTSISRPLEITSRSGRHPHECPRNPDGAHAKERLPPLSLDPLSLTRRTQFRRLASPALHRALQERQMLLIRRKRVQAGVQKQVSERLVGTLRGSGVGPRKSTAGGRAVGGVSNGEADTNSRLQGNDLLRWYSFNEARRNLLDCIAQSDSVAEAHHLMIREGVLQKRLERAVETGAQVATDVPPRIPPETTPRRHVHFGGTSTSRVSPDPRPHEPMAPARTRASTGRSESSRLTQGSLPAPDVTRLRFLDSAGNLQPVCTPAPTKTPLNTDRKTLQHLLANFEETQ